MTRCWRWPVRYNPDIVLLHGTWEKHLDNVAETVVALKKLTAARVVVLGAVPAWQRGLPTEVLQVFYAASPPGSRRDRTSRRNPSGYDAADARKAGSARRRIHLGVGEFCNAEGCLTRPATARATSSSSDQVHLTEKGSEYLIAAIIDRVLGRPAPANQPR